MLSNYSDKKRKNMANQTLTLWVLDRMALGNNISLCGRQLSYSVGASCY